MPRLLAAFLLLLLALPAAAAPSSLFLEELTSPELREAVAAGRSTILVPIGGTEQNGPHIALGKHNARVRILAGRIAQALGDALVAPVIAYVPEGSIDPPSAHMRYPGTLTIPRDAFEKTLESAARSLRHHGFRHVVLLGDHGGYRSSLDAVAARLNREWRETPARVHAAPEYYGDMGHAGREDTSLALALTPSLVRAERLPAPARNQGFVGDPREASPEAGRAMADEVVRRTVAAIRKATAGR